MMEWYFGQEAGDLVVPKEQEYFDRLPSPDSWSQWGTENSGWPDNFDAGKISSSQADEKSQQQSLFGRGSKDQVDRSYGSSNFGGSSQDSLARNSDARPDYFFNNLMPTDAMDDIFMSSLLQDDAPMSSQSNDPFSLSPQYRYSLMSSESDSANKGLDCRNVPGDAEGVRNMKCFRTPPYSPQEGSENGHDSFSNFCYGDYSDQSNEPSSSMMTSGMLLSEQENISMQSSEEDSTIEESVLMGLETVLNQLSNTTRLCLRDSLYRLAQHSKEQTVSGKTKVEDLPLDKFSLVDHADDDSRSEKIDAAVQKSNTIDRAVANLMFNKVDANVQDLLPALAAKFEHIGKSFDGVGPSNYSFDNADDTFLPSKTSDLLDQPEVPLFSQENLLAMQN